MSEYDPEDHTVDATDATQNAVVSLLDVMTHVAEELPEEKRYDVSIQIEEASDE